MQVIPLHKNGLIGAYRAAFSSPAFNNSLAKSEAQAIGKFSDFNLIACEYGTQGEDTSITVLFWNNKRAKLSDEAIQLLENYRAQHYLLVDTVTRQCPLSYWDVQELVRSPTTSEFVSKSYDRLHGEGLKAGLRFVSPLFGNFYKFEDVKSGLLRVDLHKADSFFSKKSPPTWMTDYPFAKGDRPPAVERDMAAIANSGQEVLECQYINANDSLEKQGVGRGLKVYFWMKQRPKTIGPALVKWMETARYPLVDSAAEQCPGAINMALAQAQGHTGALAENAKVIAQSAIEAFFGKSKSNCSSAKGAQRRDEKSGESEPSPKEMCNAFFTVKNDQAYAANPLSFGTEFYKQVLSWIYPNGRTPDAGARMLKSELELFRVYLGGDYRYEILAFEKSACKKLARDTFQCSFSYQSTLSSEVPVAGMVPIIKSIEGRSTGVFRRIDDAWDYRATN